MRRPTVLVLVSALFVAGSAPAAAQVIYGYTGDAYVFVTGPPYTTDMRITGSFEVPEPLPPATVSDLTGSLIDFSFWDGVYTRTPPDTLICQFEVTTDTSGRILGARIFLREAGPGSDGQQHSLEIPGPVGLSSTDAGCGPAALDPFAEPGAGGEEWRITAPTLVIPTASEVGLACLALLIAAAGLLRIRY